MIEQLSASAVLAAGYPIQHLVAVLAADALAQKITKFFWLVPSKKWALRQSSTEPFFTKRRRWIVRKVVKIATGGQLERRFLFINGLRVEQVLLIVSHLNRRVGQDALLAGEERHDAVIDVARLGHLPLFELKNDGLISLLLVPARKKAIEPC